MVFLWFSYGFPMVFLWFSYGNRSLFQVMELMAAPEQKSREVRREALLCCRRPSGAEAEPRSRRWWRIFLGKPMVVNDGI